MVDEQMYEKTMMPYDAYYAPHPIYEGQPAMYDQYPPHHPWPVCPNYPMMPYPPYLPYQAPNNFMQGNEYPRASRMQERPFEEEQVSPSTVADSKVLQQFMNDSGQVDIQKMLQTVGQFADTVQQVSPVIKQLNELVRSFRT